MYKCDDYDLHIASEFLFSFMHMISYIICVSQIHYILIKIFMTYVNVKASYVAMCFRNER